MKGEKNYVMEEKFRGQWIPLKSVRILEEHANELNRETFRSNIRYVEGEFSSQQEASQAPKEKPLADKTIRQLKAIAEERGIDLGEAKLKAEIIAAINAAEK